MSGGVSLFCDRYELQSPIVEGVAAPGNVYLAHDVETQTQVAIKLRRRVSNAKQIRRRIELARSVTHPSLCRILNHGEEIPDDVFLVTELVEGVSIRTLLDRTATLRSHQIDQFVLEIGGALAALHAGKAVHGGLASQNIRLCETDDMDSTQEPIQRFILLETAIGRSEGSLDFIAPEQKDGKELTNQTDIYSLAAVLHVLITGIEACLPATGDTPQPRSGTGRFTIMSRPGVNALLRACLEEDPRNRPSTIKEFLTRWQDWRLESHQRTPAPPPVRKSPVPPQKPKPKPETNRKPSPRPVSPDHTLRPTPQDVNQETPQFDPPATREREKAKEPRKPKPSKRDRIVKYFASCRILKDVSADCREALAKETKLIEWNAGHQILTEGNSNHRLFFLINGAIRFEKSGKKVGLLDEQGGVFGEISVVGDGRCRASAVAEENVRLLALNTKGVIRGDTPQCREFLAKLKNEYPRILEERLAAETGNSPAAPGEQAQTPSVAPQPPEAQGLKTTGKSQNIPEGTVLRGKWRVVRMIAEGGFGWVYEGTDTNLPRRVAIKFARESVSEQEFRAEAEILAQLNHSNIVRVFDYGVHQDKPFIVMEFLDGPTLSDELKKNKGRLSDDMIAQFVEQIGGALEASHNKSLVHRDLKPDNIKIVSSGESGRNRRFVLLDFGIAKQLDTTATHTRAGYGTPEYMSPEQVKCVKTTHKADIYSFGIILFELFSGQTIFPLPPKPVILDLAKVQTKHVEEPAPKLPQVTRRSIRPEIVALIDHCLAKDPAKRPKSIAEVRHTWQQIYRPPAPVWSIWTKLVIAACTLALVGLLIWALVIGPTTTAWLPESVDGFEFVPDGDATTPDGEYYQQLILRSSQGVELVFRLQYYKESGESRFYATEPLDADVLESLTGPSPKSSSPEGKATVPWAQASDLARKLGGDLPTTKQLGLIYYNASRRTDAAETNLPNVDLKTDEWTRLKAKLDSPDDTYYLGLNKQSQKYWGQEKDWTKWWRNFERGAFKEFEKQTPKGFRIAIGAD